jgi:hypothetical protein
MTDSHEGTDRGNGRYEGSYFTYRSRVRGVDSGSRSMHPAVCSLQLQNAYFSGRRRKSLVGVPSKRAAISRR